MSVSIKVAVRCRPFTVDDRLGTELSQSADEQGEVSLINCDYTTKRFPFTYCWWSAYGYQRHCHEKDMGVAEGMKLINQNDAYDGVGKKIKADVLDGNAVVLFAYGLSGSGKTFTVFGPDAVDAPEAWFKWAEPHDLWGIFPRLAYEIFKEKEDGWKVSMKYFQNVVDTVRDLMSTTGEEQSYKSGMRKDPDGFMDVEWCETKVIKTWDDLRKTFQTCNARKAIAPTQFNPMSTRGHCIMVLEVEIPDPETNRKKRGRVYVCDLAGTEPAGDIVFANYEKVHFEDGSFEYKYKGPHGDKKKTKELQDQGKKINLSLSEMAQFFMKMAEAVKKKKLKAGMSIPGCNSFFLCKYLKDTMLQARTYLFCAIRPEVQYLKYTFATLGFAKNASVVKLAPKKATVATSAAERKLMAELEAMKQLVEQLKQNQGGGGDASVIADLQAKLAAKQEDMANIGDGSGDSAEKLEQQRAEYAKRGINLHAIDGDACEHPYFGNLDEDEFRSNRFMYICSKEETVFGSKCDIQLPSLAVVKNHCKVVYDSGAKTVTLVGGKGATWHNGKPVNADQSIQLQIFDRVAMADQLMMFRWNGNEPVDGVMMSASDAVEEFQDGLANNRGAGDSNLDEERRKIMEERRQWEDEKSMMTKDKNEVDHQRAMAAVDNAILDLLPKTKEAKTNCDLLSRVGMTFDVVLEKGADYVPKVKVSVENANPKHSILLDPTEFLPKLSLLKDEMMKLRGAIDTRREYELPEHHDPLFLMFDNDFHLGTATHWPEYLLYNLETDDEEKMQDVKNAAVPYNTVGLLEVVWTPLGGVDEADWDKPPVDIAGEEDLLGKPWTYKLEIKGASDLPVFCEMAYVEYDFFGENYVTDCVQQTTYSPKFEYSHIHHVPCVTHEFIRWLKGSVEMEIHVTQHVKTPDDKIGTNNTIVVESIKTGEPKGYEVLGADKPLTEAEIKAQRLAERVVTLEDENAQLKKRVQDLEAALVDLEKTSGVKSKLQSAIVTDSVVNS